MKYKIKGLQSSATKPEKDMYQESAKIIVSEYANIVPRIKEEQYSILFVLKNKRLQVDNKSMSKELQADFKEAHDKGLL
jgi:hypothetical protein